MSFRELFLSRLWLQEIPIQARMQSNCLAMVKTISKRYLRKMWSSMTSSVEIVSNLYMTFSFKFINTVSILIYRYVDYAWVMLDSTFTNVSRAENEKYNLTGHLDSVYASCEPVINSSATWYGLWTIWRNTGRVLRGFVISGGTWHVSPEFGA